MTSDEINLRRRFCCVLLALYLVVIFPEIGRSEKFQYDGHGRRDPFVPASETIWASGQWSFKDLRLEGVVLDPMASYVVINGEIIKEGDSFSGFRVEKIDAGHVQLTKDGEAYLLYLRQEDRLAAQLEQATDGKG